MKPRLAYWTAAPDAVKAMQGVGQYILASGLDRGLIELVYLRVSQINGCAYCLDMHAEEARKAGVPQQKLDCAAAWREAPFYTERERAALAWAEALTRIEQTRAPDADYEAARAQFSDKELTDLTFAIALMNSWNRVSIGFRFGPAERKR